MHQLALQRAEERLHRRVVIAVPAAPQTQPDAVLGQQMAHPLASILLASVRVEHQILLGG